ncbi:unnamed protein product [Rhizoctonia solani]|uniref:C2H2-type domain-containing protein n=1 Tax=Rhizoctonia solani TaxID=456999 RepID=A0A8H3ANE0_9AGAM|nr:unnamed protein product [Rhizoctonia solani]
MSSVKLEVVESKPSIGSAPSDCSDLAPAGANTKQSDSEPPTPKNFSLALPKLIKEEDDDDPINYIATLFDSLTFDKSDDSDESDCSSKSDCSGEFARSDDSDSDSQCDDPPSKDVGDKNFFYASGRLHYYDKDRRVYSEEGTVVYSPLFDFALLDTFVIEGVPYWFGLDGLLSFDTDGAPYTVYTWHNEPGSVDLGDFLGSQTSSNDFVTSQPDLGTELYHSPSPSMGFSGSGQFYSTPMGKTEVFSPNVNPNSLQQSFQGGPKPLVWSPSDSEQKSPIVSSASRESSMGPPLFPEPQPGFISGIPIISKWQNEMAQAQRSATTARPVRKPSKDERRRCPVCGKMFRRPSSLEDHLNVHSGDKPHVCPFKGCNTGFATKSNMKRHFLTHRVGALENYGTGMIHQPDVVYKLDGTKPKKAAPYNSKAHHTLRFRISN